jgi:hypothetical protein
MRWAIRCRPKVERRRAGGEPPPLQERSALERAPVHQTSARDGLAGLAPGRVPVTHSRSPPALASRSLAPPRRRGGPLSRGLHNESPLPNECPVGTPSRVSLRHPRVGLDREPAAAVGVVVPGKHRARDAATRPFGSLGVRPRFWFLASVDSIRVVQSRPLDDRATRRARTSGQPWRSRGVKPFDPRTRTLV